ncbi:hypothetical protein G6011_00391 [Alternaria panax]|uniref:Uncharacterized protein n=1 Tax=Alternaria panax TaxID=48097 RepID=A0AAD4IJ10_9PLEO|nr:hypothetical protein G6011_00391 [Alternaria panax]
MALFHNEIVAIMLGVILAVVFLIWGFVYVVRRCTYLGGKCPSPIPLSAIRDEENQRFSSSHSRFSGVSQFETIGNLTISPGRRSLPLALNIVNHVGMVIGLPVGTKPVRLKDISRVSLHLPPLTPMTSTTKVNIVMAEGEAKAEPLHHESHAIYNMKIPRQVPLARHESVARERRSKHEDDIASQRAEPGIAIAKYGFDLGLTTCSAEQLEKTQHVLVIENHNNDSAENVHHADHETTHGFGSGKAMTALYHAV